MGSGVKYRRRSNNYVKIGIAALISVPILYLIFTWVRGSDNSYHAETFSQRQPAEEPYLVEGKSRVIHFLCENLIFKPQNLRTG